MLDCWKREKCLGFASDGFETYVVRVRLALRTKNKKNKRRVSEYLC